MTAPSSTSPASSGASGRRTVTVPSVATCSMRKVVAAGTVTDSSVERKSPSLIVATCDADSEDQAPIECG